MILTYTKKTPLPDLSRYNIDPAKTIIIYPVKKNKKRQSEFLTTKEWKKLAEKIDNILNGISEKMDNSFSDRKNDMPFGKSGRVGYGFGAFGDSKVIFSEPGEENIQLKNVFFDNSRNRLSVEGCEAWTDEGFPPRSFKATIPEGREPLKLEDIVLKYCNNKYRPLQRYIDFAKPLQKALIKKYGERDMDAERSVTYGRNEHIYRISVDSSESWILKFGDYGYGKWAAEAWLKEFIEQRIAIDKSFSEQMITNDPIGFLNTIGKDEVAEELLRSLQNKDWAGLFKIMNEYFVINGHLFMANKENKDLKPYEEALKLPEDEKHKMIEDLKEVVISWHKEGIIHRDLSSKNILFDVIKKQLVVKDLESSVLTMGDLLLTRPSTRNEFNPLEFNTPLGFYNVLAPKDRIDYLKFEDLLALYRLIIKLESPSLMVSTKAPDELKGSFSKLIKDPKVFLKFQSTSALRRLRRFQQDI